MALLTFEVCEPAGLMRRRRFIVNGENLGSVSLTLPDLADPGYRGETERTR